MIKIMIVDDEAWIRTSLKNKIDWSEDWIYCAEASDGYEARKLAVNLRPDIVITDVRMPGMSGIELIDGLLSILPDLQPIFISGYNEFDYVKSALELNACGYVLKPIKKEELNMAISKASTKIQQKNLLQRSTQTQLNLLNKSLESLYHSTLSVPASFYENLEYLNFYTNYFYVLLIRLLDSEEEPDQMEQQLRSITASVSPNYTCSIFPISRTVYGIFLTSNQRVPMLEYSKTLIRQLQTRASLDTSIALGEEAASIHKLTGTFASAKESLRLMHPYSTHEIILPSPKSSSKAELMLPKQIAQQILDSIYTQNPADLKNARINLEQLIRKTPSITLYEINHMLSLLLGDMIRILYESDCPSELSDRAIALMQELSSCRSGKESLDEFYQYCIQVIDAYHNFSSITQIIQSAEQYINSRFQEPISLKKMAELYHVNASYFSVSFKNVTHQNFNEYLTSVRMENAKQLLCNPTLKVNQIAHMVGYEDCSYFGKAFRKYTGCIPSEYPKQVNDRK